MITKEELAFLHKFCNKYSPESNGEDLLTRIDRIDCKLKDLLLGINGMNRKLKRSFPKELEDLW